MQANKFRVYIATLSFLGGLGHLELTCGMPQHRSTFATEQSNHSPLPFAIHSKDCKNNTVGI